MNARARIATGTLLPTWLAVQTKPNAEYLAQSEMQRVGMTVYLPQYRNEYRHHRTKAWIVKHFPLFLGYVFTPAHDVKWGALTSCDGVMRNGVICDVNGKPVPIPGEDIKVIQDAEKLGALDKLRSHALRIQAGEEVKITEGVFAGTEAVMQRAKSVNSVRVLLNMFGRQVVASGPVAKVEKMD